MGQSGKIHEPPANINEESRASKNSEKKKQPFQRIKIGRRVCCQKRSPGGHGEKKGNGEGERDFRQKEFTLTAPEVTIKIPVFHKKKEEKKALSFVY